VFFSVTMSLDGFITHTRREPRERPGGTTFHFVDDGIESALEQGTGIRLFDRVDPDRLVLDQAHADASSLVTHLTYTVGNRGQVAASLRRNESA